VVADRFEDPVGWDPVAAQGDVAVVGQMDTSFADTDRCGFGEAFQFEDHERWGVRFTKNSRGELYATMRFETGVPKKLFEWLTGYGISERDAEEFIRMHIFELADGWHNVAVHPKRRQMIAVHEKHERTALRDGFVVYPGPRIISVV
jgi:hypothetical protein